MLPWRCLKKLSDWTVAHSNLRKLSCNAVHQILLIHDHSMHWNQVTKLFYKWLTHVCHSWNCRWLRRHRCRLRPRRRRRRQWWNLESTSSVQYASACPGHRPFFRYNSIHFLLRQLNFTEFCFSASAATWYAANAGLRSTSVRFVAPLSAATGKS